jgi:uncharacterized protein YodC (DUF2158 family)
MGTQLFPNGMVVRLKSGGPKMTVVGYGKYGMAAVDDAYACKWFNESKVVEAVFSEPELEPAEKAANAGAGGVVTVPTSWMG